MSEPVIGIPVPPPAMAPATPSAPPLPAAAPKPWGWIAAGVIFILFVVFLVMYFKSSPPSTSSTSLKSSTTVAVDPPRELPPVTEAPCDPACKCYTDIEVNLENRSDKQYQNLTLKDNKTFCGTMKNGSRVGCPAKCCTPACK